MWFFMAIAVIRDGLAGPDFYAGPVFDSTIPATSV
jgi:hypothetical protein